MFISGFPRRQTTAYAIIILAVLAGHIFSEEIDDEIIRLRKELSRQQIECQRTRTDIEQENSEFNAYRSKNSLKVKNLSADIDSLDKDIAKRTSANDSVSAVISTVLAQIHQKELSQNVLRDMIISILGPVEETAEKLPPMASQTLIVSIALLKNDVSSKSVDNAEACNRLAQILNQMEETTASIASAQVASPIPEIPGIAYRIRIGGIFEALVNEKGTRTALFRGINPDGKPKWETVDNPELATLMLGAVNIREGKNLPALVTLPISGTMTKGNQ
jgi:hypothetical protein